MNEDAGTRERKEQSIPTNLLNDLRPKFQTLHTNVSKLNFVKVPAVFAGFVLDPTTEPVTAEELKSGIELWCHVEDEEDVQEAESNGGH